MMKKFTFILLTFTLFGCKKELTNINSPTKIQAYNAVNSFQCIAGNCVAAQRGPYSTISECEKYCGENENIFIDPRDGQKYRIITYKGKTWFKENLRYTEGLTQTTSIDEWLITNVPAFMIYENNQAYNDLYGVLYNGYAVKSLDLCPEGWRVATFDDYRNNIFDFPTLTKPDIMATAGWKYPRIESTNSTGYTGLPGGMINLTSGVHGLGETASWWTSDILSNGKLMVLIINGSDFNSSYIFGEDYEGYSCRCVKE
jgi:uncharacterized protein (TIGR02145 family)